MYEQISIISNYLWCAAALQSTIKEGFCSVFRSIYTNPFAIPASCPSSVIEGLVPVSGSHWVGGRVNPGQAASPLPGNIETHWTTNHALITKSNLERPISLTDMFWSVGGRWNIQREPTHAEENMQTAETSYTAVYFFYIWLSENWQTSKDTPRTFIFYIACGFNE